MHKVNFLGLLPPEKYHAVSMAMRKSKKQGFSLVEVVLALAVVAFAFVAILGLIPAGMSSFRQAINISVCSQIGQKVIADAVQADYDTLLTKPGDNSVSSSPFQMNYRYFDEEGNEIISSGAIKTLQNTKPNEPFTYLVVSRISPSITLPGTPAVVSTQTATLTVQVIFDPAQYMPGTSDFASNLMVASTTTNPPANPKIPAANVLTYYSHITRN